MFEWLDGDPLNGIAITITFFISLIIGRHLGKQRTPGKTGGSIKDPRLKLLLSFLLIISITLMKHWYIPAAISIFAVVIAARKRSLRAYSGKIIFPLVLGLFVLIIQSLTYGTQTTTYGYIQFHPEGIEYGMLIFSRVVASASVLILLILATPENEILESMRWFRMPPTLIQIMSFMVRYIKTFSHERGKLKQAQQSRCGFPEKASFAKQMQNTASVSGLLITRAFSRSEDVYRAMISRGWSPDIKYPEASVSLKRKDIIAGIALFSGIVTLIWIDMII